MIVSYLPDPESHPLWEGIRGLLARGVEDAPVFEKNELVWLAIDGPWIAGAGTTVLNKDGSAEILACGGFRHREWVGEALRIVEAWARDAGASRLVVRGRRGWWRYLAPMGWVASEVDVFTKELSVGQEEKQRKHERQWLCAGMGSTACYGRRE